MILSIRIERRWPLQALLAVALAWAAAALVAVVPAAVPGLPVALPVLAGVVAVALAVLPPVALGLLVWALLPDTGRSLLLADAETRLADARAQVDALETQLMRVDAGLATSLQRTEAMAAAASTAVPGLGSSATALEQAASRVAESGTRTQAIVDGFGAALPALERTIATVDQTLRAVSSDSAVQLRGVETTLATVHERGQAAAAEADAAIAAMTALLARIDEASARNTSALAKRAYALDAAVDGVLERTTAAVDHMREAVEGRMAALETGVDQAARQLTLLGDDSARLFNRRLELLLATAAKLQGHFAANEASSTRLQALVGEHVDAMAGRLAEFDASSHAAADALAERLETLTGQAGGLAAPIEATIAVVAALEAQADAFGNKVADVDDVVNERLAQFREGVTGLESEAGRLAANVEAMNGSISAGSSLVSDAAAGLAQQRAEIEQLAGTLAGQFDAARAALAEVEAGTEAAAARVENGLAADVARVVVAGGAAADEIKAALAAVVDDAVARLREQGAAEAEAAFGAPVQAQIAAIEAATARASKSGAAAGARLADVAEVSGSAADALAVRLAALTAQATALTAPIHGAVAAVAALEDQAEAFGNKVADVEELLNERLSGTRQSMVGLESEAERLFTSVAAVGASVQEGSNLVGDAASALARERGEIERLAGVLAEQFDAARAALAEIETGSAAAVSSIENGLAADVTRVAVAGEAAAADIRAALSAVVDEAVGKLADASGGSVVAGFSAPVRAQIEAIETATARAAATSNDVAGRLAVQMVRLAATVDTVETRIGAVDTRFAMRARDSLASRSTRLINQLNAAAVDVAGLLSITVDKADWTGYLRGDRGVFARAIAERIDSETARQMARLYEHDSNFQVEAVRFCETFEDLITRMLGDGDGEVLATMMLSSDLGKIYLAIADAGGRMAPAR